MVVAEILLLGIVEAGWVWVFGWDEVGGIGVGFLGEEGLGLDGVDWWRVEIGDWRVWIEWDVVMTVSRGVVRWVMRIVVRIGWVVGVMGVGRWIIRVWWRRIGIQLAILFGAFSILLSVYLMLLNKLLSEFSGSSALRADTADCDDTHSRKHTDYDDASGVATVILEVLLGEVDVLGGEIHDLLG